MLCLNNLYKTTTNTTQRITKHTIANCSPPNTTLNRQLIFYNSILKTTLATEVATTKAKQLVEIVNNNKYNNSSLFFVNTFLNTESYTSKIAYSTLASTSKFNNKDNMIDKAPAVLGIDPTYKPTTRDYNDAVNALYSLQSNVSTVQSWANNRKINKVDTSNLLIDEMIELCKLCDIELNDRSIIHVAGTKGKGSTCAIVESIIRQQGFTTGLFTSPHLISPRERIKINGELVSKELFAKHVFYCWDIFIENKLMFPPFFKYLSLVAFRIFNELKVDCKILEVGIGGRADCTNIFKHPVVTGISSLGFDHMNVLGDTLSEIAFEKAGIIKTDCPSFTVDQRDDALQVVLNQAKVVHSPITITPPYETYGITSKIGLEGEHQKQNSSLAIALSIVWILNNPAIDQSKREKIFSDKSKWRQYNPKLNNYTPDLFLPLPETFTKGLANVQWPGRAQHCHTLELPNVDFYLDGAHTPESAQICLDWWSTKLQSNNSNNEILVLVYNSTGGRDPNLFLAPFSEAIRSGKIPRFDFAFVPTIIADGGKVLGDEDVSKSIIDNLNVDPSRAIRLSDVNSSHENIVQLSKENPQKKLKVLITGSLYLVGYSLRCITKAHD